MIILLLISNVLANPYVKQIVGLNVTKVFVHEKCFERKRKIIPNHKTRITKVVLPMGGVHEKNSTLSIMPELISGASHFLSLEQAKRSNTLTIQNKFIVLKRMNLCQTLKGLERLHAQKVTGPFDFTSVSLHLQ